MDYNTAQQVFAEVNRKLGYQTSMTGYRQDGEHEYRVNVLYETLDMDRLEELMGVAGDRNVDIEVSKQYGVTFR